MEIKINREINDNLVETHRIRWDRTFKKSLIYFTFYAIVGLFAMGLAALDAGRSGRFWGIWSSLGFGLIVTDKKDSLDVCITGLNRKL